MTNLSFASRKDRRFLHPSHQLIINLLRPGNQDMVGPTSGIWLNHRIYARGLQTVSQPESHNNINLRPLLRFPHRKERNKSKIMSVRKSNLRFLHLYLHTICHGKNFLFKSLIQRQRFRLLVERMQFNLIHHGSNFAV